MLNKWLTAPVDTYIKHFGLSMSPVVYEVGSRDGKDGMELAERIYTGGDFWDDVMLVLCECNPAQIQGIKRNYPKATLITEAISDKAGTSDFIQLHGDANVMGSSSLDLDRAKLPWGKDNNVIQVPTRRLDGVIASLGHEDIDIMKIDIEGYTWEALQSMGDRIRDVKVYHLETEIEGTARVETNLDIALFMERKGYLCTTLEYEWPPTLQDQTWVRV